MVMTASEPAPNADWWHFSHAADIGVGGAGTTLAEAFGNVAYAMTRVVTEAPVAAREAVAIHCHAPDAELLLVEWLNALIFEMATRQLLFGRFELSIADGELRGQAWGERIDRQRHRPVVEVKGATYTALSVNQGGDGRWVACCVIDV